MRPKLGLAALALALAPAAFAADPAPTQKKPISRLHWQGFVTAAYTQPTLLGGELGLSLLTQPIADTNLFVAPRMSLLGAGGTRTMRWDLNTGIETMLWAVNAVGLGFAADVAFPNYDQASGGGLAHFRLQPLLGVRFSRLSGDGAWAIRLGFPWDTRYSWGFQAGITFQFSGVPLIGDSG